MWVALDISYHLQTIIIVPLAPGVDNSVNCVRIIVTEGGVVAIRSSVAEREARWWVMGDESGVDSRQSIVGSWGGLSEREL